jgi:hypothetical protein
MPAPTDDDNPFVTFRCPSCGNSTTARRRWAPLCDALVDDDHDADRKTRTTCETRMVEA